MAGFKGKLRLLNAAFTHVLLHAQPPPVLCYPVTYLCFMTVLNREQEEGKTSPSFGTMDTGRPLGFIRNVEIEALTCEKPVPIRCS